MEPQRLSVQPQCHSKGLVLRAFRAGKTLCKLEVDERGSGFDHSMAKQPLSQALPGNVAVRNVAGSGTWRKVSEVGGFLKDQKYPPQRVLVFQASLPFLLGPISLLCFTQRVHTELSLPSSLSPWFLVPNCVGSTWIASQRGYQAFSGLS